MGFALKLCLHRMRCDRYRANGMPVASAVAILSEFIFRSALLACTAFPALLERRNGTESKEMQPYCQQALVLQQWERKRLNRLEKRGRHSPGMTGCIRDFRQTAPETGGFRPSASYLHWMTA